MSSKNVLLFQNMGGDFDNKLDKKMNSHRLHAKFKSGYNEIIAIEITQVKYAKPCFFKNGKEMKTKKDININYCIIRATMYNESESDSKFLSETYPIQYTEKEILKHVNETYRTEFKEVLILDNFSNLNTYGTISEIINFEVENESILNARKKAYERAKQALKRLTNKKYPCVSLISKNDEYIKVRLHDYDSILNPLKLDQSKEYKYYLLDK